MPSKKRASTNAAYRSRIKGVRYVPASKLKANAHNWRKHPNSQLDALKTMLENVGFVAPIIARETPQGLEIIDGHLRAGIGQLNDDQTVPVIVVDLTEAEAKKVLATYDVIPTMALEDANVLHDLVESLNVNDKAIVDLVLSESETWGLAFDWDPVTSPAESGEQDELPASVRKTTEPGKTFYTVELNTTQAAEFEAVLTQSKKSPGQFIIQATQAYREGKWGGAKKTTKQTT